VHVSIRADGPSPGEHLGPYQLVHVLGEGAMGVVWLARDQRDQSNVALKLLRRELSADEVYSRRFLREARIAAEVDHPNLVTIREAGEADGWSYIAARHVDGPTLGELLRDRGPLSVDEVVRIVGDVAAGIDALHRSGLVHRDVKPSNVLVDADGRAALTDFGLATGPAYTVLTRPGQLIGTVDYLAPELIAGAPAGNAADIYALGCVTFACLTGAAPFAGRRAFETTVAHLGEDPRNPCAERDDAPSGLGAAVLTALEKEPEKRPVSARAYALSLFRASR
jgi:serine/threonine protein kinase